MTPSERSDSRPVMALRRDPRGGLDDVVAKDVVMFRAEMMSEGSLWVACYFDEGVDQQVSFNISAVKKGVLAFEVGELPDGGYVDFDKLEVVSPPPVGMEWEYREGEDGGGNISVGAGGKLKAETILPTRFRRAVGPWEVVRERTQI